MSVLIEALSLVIQRITLDLSWPGGADAFLEAMCAPDCPARRLCSDDKLVSVSFFSPDDALAVVAGLRENGLIELDDQRFHDLALVDQREGPTMPCAWLEWKQHRDGFTYAWLAGTEPGDMAAPADWTAEQSARLTRTDLRDEPGRMLKLAEEGDIETWLDFQTGQVTVGMKRLAERTAGGSGNSDGSAPSANDSPEEVLMAEREPWQDADAGRGLLGVVKSALAERNFKCHRFEDDSIFGRLRTDKATYELFVVADEERETVSFYLIFPTHAPEARRAAVAELCARANWEMFIGALDMDYSDGDVRFRSGIDVEDGVLSPTMVHNIISAAAWTLDNYHDALVKVMIAGEDPGTAFAGVST